MPTGWPSRVLARGILHALSAAIRLFCRVPVQVSDASEPARHRPSIVVSNHHSLFHNPVVLLALPAGRRRSTASVVGLDFLAVRTEPPRYERVLRRVVI